MSTFRKYLLQGNYWYPWDVLLPCSNGRMRFIRKISTTYQTIRRQIPVCCNTIYTNLSSTLIFWDVTLHRLVNGLRGFERKFRLLLQGPRKRHVSSKSQWSRVTSQRTGTPTTIPRFTADLTHQFLCCNGSFLTRPLFVNTDKIVPLLLPQKPKKKTCPW